MTGVLRVWLVRCDGMPGAHGRNEACVHPYAELLCGRQRRRTRVVALGVATLAVK